MKQNGKEILKRIIEEKGILILTDRKVLGSLLADLFNDDAKESRAMQIAVREGVGDYFYELANEKGVGFRVALSRCYEFLTEDIGLSKDRASYIMNAFMHALGCGSINGAKESQYYGNNNEDITEEERAEIGIKLLRSEDSASVIEGIDILKECHSDKAYYYLATEYIEGRILSRSFEKAASYLRKGINYPECELEMAKLLFYGWGVRKDIRKAIKYFEDYLKKTSSALESPDIQSASSILSAVPFLIQCYYEDLLISGSSRSLEKLSNYADFHGFRMAQRYLLRYYADSDNKRHNTFLAEKYMKKLHRNKENPYVMLTKARGGVKSLDEVIRVSMGLYLYSDNQYESSMVMMKNHLLLGEEVNSDASEDSGSLAYYLMGIMLAEDNYKDDAGCEKAKIKASIRAEIYLKNYLEMVSADCAHENYVHALSTYSRLLLTHDHSSKKWSSAEYIASLAKEMSGTSSAGDLIISDMLSKVKYYGSKGETVKAIACLEKAVEHGYNDDYSIIGIMYVNGDEGLSKDTDKGFYWLNRFYTDYKLNRLRLSKSADIGMVEYYLSQCFELGLGTDKDHERAHELFLDAASHGNMEAARWLNFSKILEAV